MKLIKDTVVPKHGRQPQDRSPKSDASASIYEGQPIDFSCGSAIPTFISKDQLIEVLSILLHTLACNASTCVRL